MFKVSSHPLDRRFYAVVVGIGTISSAAILATLYLLTASFDRFVVEQGLTLSTVQPGLLFRESVLPWVLMVCAALTLLTIWIGAYYLRLLRSLENMHKVATTDNLTGVGNRTALTETLNTSSVQGALDGGRLAVISLDLNDFKRLNDERGHQAGDIALRTAADRIAATMRRYEKVFRIGGDEFLCLVFDPEPLLAAEKVADRLRDSFKAPMVLGGFSQIVSPSIGVAAANRGDTWDAVLGRSDAAMYVAKRSGLAGASDQDSGCSVSQLRAYQTK